MAFNQLFPAFAQLELNQKATEVYLKLINLGPTTVLELSQVLRWPRTTVHRNCEQLIQKGLVTQLINGKKRQLIAEPLEKLKVRIFEKRAELEAQAAQINILESEADQIISQLNTLVNHTQTIPTQLQFIEGRDKVSKLYDEILQAPVIRSYASVLDIWPIFPENFAKFAAAAKRGVEIYDLFEDTPESRQAEGEFRKLKLPTYYGKFFPKGFKLQSMDYLIYNNTIATVQSNDYPSAIIIKSSLLYENAVKTYDLLWNFIPNK